MDPSRIARYPLTIDGETVEIGTANELAVALDVLQGQHDRAALEQLRPALADITAGPLGFARLLQSLSADDQIYLIDAIGPRLAEIIQESRRLRDIFAALAVTEVEQKILGTLGGDGLRALVKTAGELSEVLGWLYGQADRQAVELLGTPYLKRLIRTGTDLSVVLEALDARGQRDLLERLGWECTGGLVRSGVELAKVMRVLPAELSGCLIAEMSRDDLVAIIGNPHDWQYLWERLEPEECRMIAEKLGVDYAA